MAQFNAALTLMEQVRASVVAVTSSLVGGNHVHGGDWREGAGGIKRFLRGRGIAPGRFLIGVPYGLPLVELG